jgi:hypothetical protein
MLQFQFRHRLADQFVLPLPLRRLTHDDRPILLERHHFVPGSKKAKE